VDEDAVVNRGDGADHLFAGGFEAVSDPESAGWLRHYLYDLAVDGAREEFVAGGRYRGDRLVARGKIEVVDQHRRGIEQSFFQRGEPEPVLVVFQHMRNRNVVEVIFGRRMKVEAPVPENTVLVNAHPQVFRPVGAECDHPRWK